MLKNLLIILIEFKNKFISSRIFLISIIYLFLASVLLFKLITLQIVQGENYQNEYEQKIERIVTTPATRGNIYDCNGNLLAYNKLAYAVTIQDNAYYKEKTDFYAMLYKLIQILYSHDEKVIASMEIGIDQDDNYVYTASSDIAKKRFLRDLYGLRNIDELDDKAGKYSSTISAEELVENRMDYYKLDELTDDAGNKIELNKQEKLDLLNILYTISLTRYRKYEESKIASSVSEGTKIEILENASELLGVNIDEESIRVYNDSLYFSSIVGYIGKIQEDQLSEESEYTINDSIGRVGIEKEMEDILKGEKGDKTMYVDSVGHIMEVTAETPAIPGNDVYLNIDRNLQIGTYHLIEQQLAGILATKLVNEEEPNNELKDSTSRLIPVKDAYFQLINNNVLDMNHFAMNDASSTEAAIESKFLSYKEATLNTINAELNSPSASKVSELPEDIKVYMYYIFKKLAEEEIGIILPSVPDTNTDYMNSWEENEISLRELLYHGISEGWIDVTKFPSDDKYSDSGIVYERLVTYINSILEEDTEYLKLLYKYMIKNNILTGKELCIALYDQGVLAYDEVAVNELNANGEDYAYEFLVNKIKNIEITPAQLALDPCTAGVVITDTRTGEVRALVSYPGYDNNRLTNTMDADYYSKLLDDQSIPLYNNTTQTRKAPGSTFKPISAIAALEEGVVTPEEKIECTGIYEEVSPSIKCWIYPGKHKELDVVGALENSCNVYFVEIGHRLSTDANDEYHTNLGIENIRKYAVMFGLDHTSGIELAENEPLISDENPEQSAIGQGTHSFANVQLSRYMCAMASKGNIFEISILDKVTDSRGNLLTDYAPNVSGHIDISETTWELVHAGMRKVIEDGPASKIFSDLEVEIAGKTGTAQESKSRANHAFFVSFAPYINPEVAVTVNIPFGYSSSNAAAIAKNVYSFYFGYTNVDEIMENSALNVTNVNIGD